MLGFECSMSGISEIIGQPRCHGTSIGLFLGSFPQPFHKFPGSFFRLTLLIVEDLSPWLRYTPCQFPAEKGFWIGPMS
jgi:hypothetical protein